MTAGVPVLKDLVLVGGGHSHVIVLRRLGMRPIPGVRITVVARDLHAPYSGMLPGLVAGHYGFDEVHVDLGPLARFAGARLFHAEAVGIDLERRAVRCRGRPPIPYDVLSIDTGIAPRLDAPGAAEHAVPVKPIGGLVARWERLERRVRASPRKLRIAVVGAGAAGVELTLSMQHALAAARGGDGPADRGRPPARTADAARGGDGPFPAPEFHPAPGAPSAPGSSPFPAPEFHLFGAAPTVLPTHNHGARRRFGRLLAARGVRVHLGTRVTRVDAGRLETAGGASFEVDEIVWASAAAPPAWPAASGLAVDGAGFIAVDATLQSTSHPGVFAAGDVAAVEDHPREKAGVFAVRQGKPLAANLRRALLGERLRPFRPQRRFLSLIGAGGRYAVASRGRWSAEGAWVWRWKEWIDRRFMRRFSDLPEMEEETARRAPAVPPGLAPPDVVRELSVAAMRCGGCGSKIGATLLDRVVARLEPLRRDDVVVGLDAPDDAAVSTPPPGKLLVQSVDAFRSMIDDPWLFGRITANHCLSDLYAMGAEPCSALAIVTIPHGLESKQEILLEDLLSGAVAVLNEGGAALLGGHTAEGAEVQLGLSVSGSIDAGRILRKGGLRPGDRLVLTKPIGTGTLLAADMRGRAKARWLDGAIRAMLQSNRDAAGALRDHGGRACTDVTGFGLLGHLVEMTRASGVDARLTLDAVPLLDGAQETAARGLLSSLQPQNVRLRRAVANVETAGADPRYPLLFDPQTAGGLLAGVPEDRAAACVARLHALGYTHAAVVGVAAERDDAAPPITIT